MIDDLVIGIYVVVFGLLICIPTSRYCWRKYSRLARQASIDALKDAAPPGEKADEPS